LHTPNLGSRKSEVEKEFYLGNGSAIGDITKKKPVSHSQKTKIVLTGTREKTEKDRVGTLVRDMNKGAEGGVGRGCFVNHGKTGNGSCQRRSAQIKVKRGAAKRTTKKKRRSPNPARGMRGSDRTVGTGKALLTGEKGSRPKDRLGQILGMSPCSHEPKKEDNTPNVQLRLG